LIESDPIDTELLQRRIIALADYLIVALSKIDAKIESIENPKK
jgi:hypothetical protein